VAHLEVTAAVVAILALAEQFCLEVARDFPRVVFVAGTLVFEKERIFQRLLHDETAYQLQRRLQFGGLNAMVLPVRAMEPVRGRPPGAVAGHAGRRRARGPGGRGGAPLMGRGP
jgi:hypothetical protein